MENPNSICYATTLLPPEEMPAFLQTPNGLPSSWFHTAVQNACFCIPRPIAFATTHHRYLPVLGKVRNVENLYRSLPLSWKHTCDNTQTLVTVLLRHDIHATEEIAKFKTSSPFSACSYPWWSFLLDISSFFSTWLFSVSYKKIIMRRYIYHQINATASSNGEVA